MSTTSCPSCTQPVSGRFCSHCGAAAATDASCRGCSAPLPAGARFCNTCGAGVNAPADAATVGSAPASATSRAPWAVAAVAVVALIAVAIWPRGDGTAGPAGVTPPVASGLAAGGAGGPGGIDLASMSAREAADRLFDRIMRSAAAGDSAEARRFVPMGLGAYERVEEMDLDAHYHVGVLQLLAGDAAAARAAADVILAAEPNHLFGLFTAAQAAQMLGREAEARSFFQRFLDRYPTEIVRDLQEYSAHAPALPEMRAEAQRAVQ
jgi:hypothetical protein